MQHSLQETFHYYLYVSLLTLINEEDDIKGENYKALFCWEQGSILNLYHGWMARLDGHAKRGRQGRDHNL